MPGGIKKIPVPPEVRAKGRPSLTAVTTRTEVTLFLSEDEWRLKKYPRDCPLELKLGSWAIDNVQLVVLLLRVARTDATTFDCWLNVSHATGHRILQNLSLQDEIQLHLAAEEVARTFRLPSLLRREATQLIDKFRSHDPWRPEDFERALARLNQLYPTPHAVWWACAQAGKP